MYVPWLGKEKCLWFFYIFWLLHNNIMPPSKASPFPDEDLWLAIGEVCPLVGNKNKHCALVNYLNVVQVVCTVGVLALFYKLEMQMEESVTCCTCALRFPSFRVHHLGEKSTRMINCKLGNQILQITTEEEEGGREELKEPPLREREKSRYSKHLIESIKRWSWMANNQGEGDHSGLGVHGVPSSATNFLYCSLNFYFPILHSSLPCSSSFFLAWSNLVQ